MAWWSKEKYEYPMKTDDALKLLYVAQSEEEVQLVMSYLDFNGIKALRKAKGAGSYLSIVYGFSNQGTDLYVLESDFEEATKVLETLDYSHDNLSENETGNDSVSDINEAEVKYKKKRLSIIWIMITLIFCIPLLIVLVNFVITNWT